MKGTRIISQYIHTPPQKNWLGILCEVKNLIALAKGIIYLAGYSSLYM